MLITKIFKILKDIFIRRYIREINFYFATLTFGECFSVLLALFRSYLNKEDIVRGGYINKFEKEFSKYIGVDSAFSFGSGRVAFYAILKAIGVKAGDEVIVPSCTCAVVPNAILYCHAKPIYVDIEPHTFNIDIDKIEEKITRNTKIIVAQHTFGLPIDMDKLMKIAKRYNIIVVEDCAQALGAEYKGRKVGTFGNAAFFSFELSKDITTGWGGMAVTDDNAIKKALEVEQRKASFLDEKMIKKLSIQIIFSYFLYNPWNYWWGKYILMMMYKTKFFISSIKEEEKKGKKYRRYFCRLSNIQAMIGLSQLHNLNNIKENRIKVAKKYVEMFKRVGISVNEADTSTYKPNYLRYTFLVDNRDECIKYFRKYQIELGQWFNKVIICTSLPLEQLNYQKGSCPNAEWFVEHSVNLPTHPRLSNKDLARIIKVMQGFLVNKKIKK